jgi:hypothetical protein
VYEPGLLYGPNCGVDSWGYWVASSSRLDSDYLSRVESKFSVSWVCVGGLVEGYKNKRE